MEPRVTYSDKAVAALVASASARAWTESRAGRASLNFPALTQVKEQDGVKVDAARLEADIRAALKSPDERTVAAVTTVTKPKVTRAQLASKYPTLLVVDRASFKLRLYKKLRLRKTYTVVRRGGRVRHPHGALQHPEQGRERGLERPEQAVGGRHWPARSSPAGRPTTRSRRAGWASTTAPASTAPTRSAPSAARASHGCVRMAIPDVIELYDQVAGREPGLHRLRVT